jgi:hypothetical protein
LLIAFDEFYMSVGGIKYELRTTNTIPFCGKPHEDANAHLQHFLEVCGTFTVKGVTSNAIRLCLFPFSLLVF